MLRASPLPLAYAVPGCRLEHVPTGVFGSLDRLRSLSINSDYSSSLAMSDNMSDLFMSYCVLPNPPPSPQHVNGQQHEGYLSQAQPTPSQQHQQAALHDQHHQQDQWSLVVKKWKSPCMLKISDTVFIKMRFTAVDGAFQLYGHLNNSRYELREMCQHFSAAYQWNNPKDLKEEWRVGEACVAKLEDNNRWYRAQVVEVSQWAKEVAVIYVDLGNVRSVNIEDLRIPRAFGDKVCRAKFNLVHQ